MIGQKSIREMGGGGGGVAIRMSRCAFSIQIWLRVGRKRKHVRIQAYFSIPEVCLREGEDPPLPQNCKNISPWFPTMLILKCT